MARSATKAASKAAAKPKKKTIRLGRRASLFELMPTDNWHRAKHYVHHEIESKDWLNKVKEYIKRKYDKTVVANINKLPDWKIGNYSHWATTAAMLEQAPELVPDTYKTGIDKWIAILNEEGKLVVAEKKKEEKAKANVYVPTIQERMRETCSVMTESIEEFLDNFVRNPDTVAAKEFNPVSELRKNLAKPGHARIIRKWYVGERDELHELNNPPSAAALKKMSDYDKEMVAQLKEGYRHLDAKQKKIMLEVFQKIVDACDIIERESKTTRAPRKVKAKSPEKQVEKLKFKISDDKYGIASVPPANLIGANIALVFNTKTRKLGMYRASNVDPKGLARVGTGFSVKGTTLVGYDENTSIQKTVRKPEELLPQLRKTTRSKTEKVFEAISTTDTKLNGRFNEDTVILAVF
jgi:hypothetical protein